MRVDDESEHVRVYLGKKKKRLFKIACAMFNKTQSGFVKEAIHALIDNLPENIKNSSAVSGTNREN